MESIRLGSHHQWKNDIPSISDKLDEAKSKLHHGKPVVILMKTEMGNGVDFMMHTHKWYGTAPNEEQQTKAALAQLPETPLGDFAFDPTL